MRASEQYGLRWNQIDFKRKQLTLHRTKNGKPRHLPLNDAAIAALELLKADAGVSSGVSLKDAPVFPSSRTEDAVQGPRGWFTAAVERAKVKAYTWHCNRHTFASKLVQAGVDLPTVGELLGHRSLQMTLRYAHLAPEHKVSAVSKLVFS